MLKYYLLSENLIIPINKQILFLSVWEKGINENNTVDDRLNLLITIIIYVCTFAKDLVQTNVVE